jgi:hypothetical protein
MKPLRHCILPESEPQVKQKGGWNIGLVRQDELALSPDYPYNVGAGYVTEGHQHGGGYGPASKWLRDLTPALQ